MLAAQWKFPLKTIEFDSAEASRTVRNAVASQEDIRASVLATLEHCRAKALDRHEIRTAIRACEAIAGVMGLTSKDSTLTLKLEAEHSELFRRLSEKLPKDVFERVLEAAAGEERQSGV